MAGLAVGLGGGVEAVAVVGDPEGEEMGRLGELELDLGGVGVFEGVGDGLLGDHAEVVGDVGRDGADGVEIERDGDAFGGAGGEEFEGLGQGGGVPGFAEVGDEVAGFALDAGDEAAAGFEQRAGFFLEGTRGGGIEAEGEAGELLLQGVVKLAGDALALVEGGLVGDFAFQTGDLSALEGDPDEGEQNQPAEQGDGENESAGIPKGRGAEHLDVRGGAQEEGGAVGLGAEAFVGGGGLDEADAGELAEGAELETGRGVLQKEGADGGAAGGEAQLVAVAGAEEVVQHGGRGELDEIGIVRAVLKLPQRYIRHARVVSGLRTQHDCIRQGGAEALHDGKADDFGEITRLEGMRG